jgi:hypothetical protein
MATFVVLVGPLVAALDAGLWLALGGAVTVAVCVAVAVRVAVAVCVAAGGAVGAALRVAAMLLTAEEILPPAPHAVIRQVITTIRPASPARVFVTGDLPACD